MLRLHTSSPTSLPLVLAALIFLSGCGSGDDARNYTVRVFDHAGVLDAATRDRLNALSGFPADVPVVVETIDSLGADLSGDQALERMRSLGYWTEVRPKNWFQRNVKVNPPEATGVYMLVSRHPDLIQIRFGERVRIFAYRSGLVIGPGYRKIQDDYLASADRSSALERIVVDLRDRTVGAFDAPWYLTTFGWPHAISFAKMLEWTEFRGAFYDRYILRPVAGVFIGLHLIDKPWAMVTVSALVLIILNLLFSSLFRRWRKKPTRISSALMYMVQYGTIVIASYVFYHIVQALIGGRIEDELYLRSAGITGYSFPSGGSWVYSNTGFWIALIGGLTVAFKEQFMGGSTRTYIVFGSKRTAEWMREQQEDEDSFGGTLLAWTVLLLFVPRGLTVLVIAFEATSVAMITAGRRFLSRNGPAEAVAPQMQVSTSGAHQEEEF